MAIVDGNVRSVQGSRLFCSRRDASCAASVCPLPVQVVVLAALFALVAWSSYSVARILTPASAPTTSAAASSANYDARVAQLAAETERRVKLIEERQSACRRPRQRKYRHGRASPPWLLSPPKQARPARGGPFDGDKADPTFKQLFTSWKKLDNLAVGAIAVPSDKPVKTAAFTSGYGVRSDPFRRGAAMHAGIDLAGPSARRSTPPPTASSAAPAGTSGGYGNLVKIDHGRGIETRYGHFRDPRLARPAHQARPADRPDGLDRPLDRQPPALRSPHRRPRRSIRSRS